VHDIDNRLDELRFKAEFRGSKRGFRGGLEAEFRVSGGWADHPSLRFDFQLENVSAWVRGSRFSTAACKITHIFINKKGFNKSQGP
jgi:hypothetical protein